MKRITITEMQNVVSAYIQERKKIKVRIDIEGFARKAGPFAVVTLHDQLYKLNQAYNIAKDYFDTRK